VEIQDYNALISNSICRSVERPDNVAAIAAELVNIVGTSAAASEVKYRLARTCLMLAFHSVITGHLACSEFEVIVEKLLKYHRIPARLFYRIIESGFSLDPFLTSCNIGGKHGLMNIMGLETDDIESLNIATTALVISDEFQMLSHPLFRHAYNGMIVLNIAIRHLSLCLHDNYQEELDLVNTFVESQFHDIYPFLKNHRVVNLILCSSQYVDALKLNISCLLETSGDDSLHVIACLDKALYSACRDGDLSGLFSDKRLLAMQYPIFDSGYTSQADRQNTIKFLWMAKNLLVKRFLTEGVTIIHTDADALWLDDNITFLSGVLNERDIVAQGAGILPRQVSKIVGHSNVICTGFFACKPTKQALQYMEDVCLLTPALRTCQAPMNLLWYLARHWLRPNEYGSAIDVYSQRYDPPLKIQLIHHPYCLRGMPAALEASGTHKILHYFYRAGGLNDVESLVNGYRTKLD
jgi:hypothetical protein